MITVVRIHKIGCRFSHQVIDCCPLASDVDLDGFLQPGFSLTVMKQRHLQAMGAQHRITIPLALKQFEAGYPALCIHIRLFSRICG